MAAYPNGTLIRHTTSGRINHWITAGSLILMALSGLALFHPSLFFLTHLFGGGQTTRILHPWIGVVLFFSFAGLFIRFWSYNLWNRDDTQWMKQSGDVINAREEKLPAASWERLSPAAIASDWRWAMAVRAESRRTGPRPLPAR